MADDGGINLDTERIKTPRSIITLIVFVVTNIVVLFPFHIPVFVPRRLYHFSWDIAASLRLIAPRRADDGLGTEIPIDGADDGGGRTGGSGEGGRFVRLRFPMDFTTAPLIADLFLLAILAIGRDEVYGGTIGEEGIHPYDIMLFFLTLAYIAISIDASGLIRYLAFKVLQWGGEVGQRLFLYLYVFFFGLASFIGNDPIILSGTAFLAYMTRVSKNIVHPRAWIFTQFAVANIASAILVSSNPTNLVLAGAFGIKFIEYTANMVVPVVVTGIVLFPFLLYVVFADQTLIPDEIEMHQLSEAAKARKAVNPNIPHARGNAGEEEERAGANGEKGKQLSLEEIMNPYLDTKGAMFGAAVMAATLVAVLVVNAAVTTAQTGTVHVFYVTLPAAIVMLCWDLASGWLNRNETREIAEKGRQEIERAREGQASVEGVSQVVDAHSGSEDAVSTRSRHSDNTLGLDGRGGNEPAAKSRAGGKCHTPSETEGAGPPATAEASAHSKEDDGALSVPAVEAQKHEETEQGVLGPPPSEEKGAATSKEETGAATDDVEKRALSKEGSPAPDAVQDVRGQPTNLAGLARKAHAELQITFPTVMAVMAHLPLALIPFAFCMFVLVQALVRSGWVPVFAYGWDHWVNKTGVIGAIGGMGFLSVVLCNFSGTNIGTTILLCRVIQAWTKIREVNGQPMSQRMFWATVYSMALGVNYGAFSTSFSASLAGLLWRDILARKHIRVSAREFARVNLSIIAVSMTVGCLVLIGEVWLTRSDTELYVAK